MNTSETTPYIPPTRDACIEAAYRITVVVQMLDVHEERGTDENPEEDPSGYDLSAASAMLREIRALLRRAAAADKAGTR